MSSLREPLLPKYAAETPRSPKATSLAHTAAVFTCFVAVRSLHPIIIDVSKTNGKLPYGKATPCVINSAADIVIGNLLAFAYGGPEGVRQCWNPVTLKIFGAVAVLYAFGDFLEMQSMSVMGGAAYQILLQSKLVVTAIIIWVLRGKRQTSLQWNVLVTISVGMSAFVLVDDSPSQSPFRPIGLLFVLAKVLFSCWCAVLVEKHLKALQHMPIYAQVAQLKFTWLWVSLALTLWFDKEVVNHGFFSGWDGRTLVVAISWICKGWTTFSVLRNLDSVLKNIGEAAAIIVIYMFDVLIAEAVSPYIPVSPKSFKLSTFLMVLVIVLTAVTYTMTTAKANQKD